MLMSLMGFFHADGHHATVSNLAVLMFELDSGVMDVKVTRELFLEVAENRLTRRRRDIGNRDVTRQRMHL